MHVKNQKSKKQPATLMHQKIKKSGNMMDHVAHRRFRETKAHTQDILRTLVVEKRRMDILAEFVLGYDPPQWFHKEMTDFQDEYNEGMILAFRGARKTTYCTITRCLMEIIQNPNIRILLGADSFDQAKIFLREIKHHLEKNEYFHRLFGDLSVGSEKWSESEIIINTRTRGFKEATITCVGSGTQFTGRHFDVIILDDLVIEENVATEGLRQKTHNYFYKTLLPCLEPDGRLWIIGTRWHEEDLYDHFAKFDYKTEHMILRILDDDEQSIWEDRFPTTRMHRIRTGNLAAFELQWMCRSGVGVGNIFVPDHFRFYEALPPNVVKWQGVDLAISQKECADFFAHVTVGVQKLTSFPFLVDYRKTKIPYTQQPKFVADRFNTHPDVCGVAVETNQYQDALRQQIIKDYPYVPTLGRWTHKDKITRANQLALILANHPLHILHQHKEFQRLLLGFPHIKGSKDLFDAFELALSIGLKGRRKSRRNEPGLI